MSYLPKRSMSGLGDSGGVCPDGKKWDPNFVLIENGVSASPGACTAIGLPYQAPPSGPGVGSTLLSIFGTFLKGKNSTGAAVAQAPSSGMSTTTMAVIGVVAVGAVAFLVTRRKAD